MAAGAYDRITPEAESSVKAWLQNVIIPILVVQYLAENDRMTVGRENVQ